MENVKKKFKIFLTSEIFFKYFQKIRNYLMFIVFRKEEEKIAFLLVLPKEESSTRALHPVSESRGGPLSVTDKVRTNVQKSSCLYGIMNNFKLQSLVHVSFVLGSMIVT